MKKIFLLTGLMMLAALALTSCGDDDDPDIIDPIYYGYHYAYIVNNGNWNANDGTVAALDYNEGKWTVTDIYQQSNGYGIGDAQDMLPVNGKLFVTSTTSSKIEVLDKDGKLLYRKLLPNKSPRFLTQQGKYVYFTAYSGYVYKMDVESYELTDSVAVEGFPEAIVSARGKLYVAQSDYTMDGTGKYITVIDIDKFRVTKKIEVALNPYNQMVVAGNGETVFFVSNLDYSDNLLQCIDTKTDLVTTVGKATTIALDANIYKLVCVYSVWGNSEKRYFRYDVQTGQSTDIEGLKEVPNIGQVSVDWKTGDIYAVNNDYAGPCQLYVFDKDGNLQRTLTSGSGTARVIFSKE